MTQGSDGATAKGGVLGDWILPILVGLAIGAGLVWGWRALRSPTEKLVARWTWEDYEGNAQLGESIRGLGKEAREDLLAAFRAIEVPDDGAGLDHKKVWAAELLAADPFFDTRSLLDLVRDPAAPKWDRRAAAAALVDVLRKDVDVQAVVGPLLGWLEDLAALDHSVPIVRLKTLRHDEVFPPDRDEPWRRALMRLADPSSRPQPANPEDAWRLVDDRLRSLYELGDASGDPEVKAFLWRIASDESEEAAARVAAIRGLAEKARKDAPDPFADHEKWIALTKSADATVRQSVAENLFRTGDPAYDPALAALHADPEELVRSGSLYAQVARGRPTMLPIMDQLLEDHSEAVRSQALIACGVFKDHADGIGARQGMILRLLELSESDDDVSGAVVALALMTGQHFGFGEGDVDLRNREVNDAAVAAFRSDREGRRLAVEKWRARLGGAAVWTDDDRRKTLEKLLLHADPANVERAKRELGR